MHYSFYKKADISLIFVVVLWGFMWLLWFPYRPTTKNGRIPSNMSVSLYQFSHSSRAFLMNPLIFEAKPQLQVTEQNAGILSHASIPHPTLPPNLLERSETLIKDSSTLSYFQSVIESLRKYTPISSADMSSSFSKHSVFPVNVQLEGELATRGFEIPDFSEEIKKQRGHHQVVLSVNIGDTGRPNAAFVMHSSGDTTFDLMIVKTILKGRTTKTGPPCEGTITITHKYP